MREFFQDLRQDEWPFVHGIMAALLVTAFLIGLIKMALL